MNRCSLTYRQNAFALQHAEPGTAAGEVIREMGIIEKIFCQGKQKYG